MQLSFLADLLLSLHQVRNLSLLNVFSFQTLVLKLFLENFPFFLQLLGLSGVRSVCLTKTFLKLRTGKQNLFYLFIHRSRQSNRGTGQRSRSPKTGRGRRRGSRSRSSRYRLCQRSWSRGSRSRERCRRRFKPERIGRRKFFKPERSGRQKWFASLYRRTGSSSWKLRRRSEQCCRWSRTTAWRSSCRSRTSAIGILGGPDDLCSPKISCFRKREKHTAGTIRKILFYFFCLAANSKIEIWVCWSKTVIRVSCSAADWQWYCFSLLRPWRRHLYRELKISCSIIICI